jgi:tetrahydromethanopterin S-methyltransferase subunit B
MISNFLLCLGIAITSGNIQEQIILPPLPAQEEVIEDGLLDKILENIKQESRTQRALIGIISNKVLDIEDLLKKINERDNFQPLRNQIEELKELVKNIELRPDIQPLRNLIQELSNKVDDLFNKNETERVKVLENIKEILSERLSSIKDIQDRLNILPNLVEQINQERERRRLIDVVIERMDVRSKAIEERINSVDLRLRPLEALANWIHNIINGIFYIALKIFGVIIGILLGLALIRAVFARLFPELYSKIASTIKFVFMIP